MSGGGYLVPDSLVEWTFDWLTSPRVIHISPWTWEERLAQAVEARSLHNRWHVFRWIIQSRLSLAWDALRGEHDCGERA